MTQGYLLAGNERVKNGIYINSEPMKYFIENSGKIAALFILRNKIEGIDFNTEDNEYFQKIVKIWYSDEDSKIEDMKNYSLQILKEQSLIAAVSYWEGYFQEISEIILNDDAFIQRIFKNESKNKENFKKFLNGLPLMQDFSNEVLFNGNKMDGLQFGTYIRDQEKNYFQKVGNVRKFLKLCDVKIIEEMIDNKDPNWGKITSLFEDRHQIVHNPNNSDIVKNYTNDKIELIIMNMSKIISHVDESLFADDSNPIDMNIFA